MSSPQGRNWFQGRQNLQARELFALSGLTLSRLLRLAAGHPLVWAVWQDSMPPLSFQLRQGRVARQNLSLSKKRERRGRAKNAARAVVVEEPPTAVQLPKGSRNGAIETLPNAISVWRLRPAAACEGTAQQWDMAGQPRQLRA